MASILLINGPNLNLLGTREPGVYGKTGLAEIVASCAQIAEESGHGFEHLQSNDELALIERVQAARDDGTALIVLNPAAFTHQSVALRDAIAAAAVPFIEVHLSNPKAREMFRHHSLFSDLALGVISGFGAAGYESGPCWRVFATCPPRPPVVVIDATRFFQPSVRSRPDG
ncbi:MAG: 3-dehydroquinate dehydratase, partial [Ahniella sp.]|nr:3-dehydroquinate dehydratase [Ahniella sp.]